MNKQTRKKLKSLRTQIQGLVSEGDALVERFENYGKKVSALAESGL